MDANKKESKLFNTLQIQKIHRTLITLRWDLLQQTYTILDFSFSLLEVKADLIDFPDTEKKVPLSSFKITILR